MKCLACISSYLVIGGNVSSVASGATGRKNCPNRHGFTAATKLSVSSSLLWQGPLNLSFVYTISLSNPHVPGHKSKSPLKKKVSPDIVASQQCEGMGGKKLPDTLQSGTRPQKRSRSADYKSF